LIVKTPEEVNTKYNDNIHDKELIQKRHEHYEEKRRGRLDLLKKVRAEVVDEEAKGTWNSQNVTLSIILED
jgi:hypothetical protein